MTRDFYTEGYEEGRRSGLSCVVPMRESVLLASAQDVIDDESQYYAMRAYWTGMKRGFRNHYADAYSPTVLAARSRRH